MWIGVLWAGLRIATWITHAGGKFSHGLLEKSLKHAKPSFEQRTLGKSMRKSRPSLEAHLTGMLLLRSDQHPARKFIMQSLGYQHLREPQEIRSANHLEGVLKRHPKLAGEELGTWR